MSPHCRDETPTDTGRDAFAALAMNRRGFLQRMGVGAAAGIAVAQPGSSWLQSVAAVTGVGDPYGPLGEPDASGLRVPSGFSARVVAEAGKPVGDTSYSWHSAPDGGATFTMDDGGWVYVSNREKGFGDGGVGAIRFDAGGEIVDAYTILEGTTRNCAGGPTPWGTWLSCEEFDAFGNAEQITKAGGFTAGRVWECDPSTPGQGVAKPAMGVFVHEGVAVDDENEHLYLTEDHGEGRFYRFTPDSYPALDSGLLEVAVVDDAMDVTWLPVPDPLAETAPTRSQVPESTAFDGGEGIWYRDGHIYFSTKGDDHIWVLDTRQQQLSVLYDGSESMPLHEVDNLTIGPQEVLDIYVAEDGDDLQVVIITEEGPLAPFLQAVGPDHEGSELTGPAFSPDGSRFYVSSQRGGKERLGITWEVTGPFRDSAASTDPTASTTTMGSGVTATTAASGAGEPGDAGGDDAGEGDSAPILPIAAVGVAIAAGAALAVRSRTRTSSE